MPEGHHRAHQHALRGYGCLVTGDDRRHRQLHRQQGGRGALPCRSANRDEACFANPDRFDITRDTAKSIAFGAGPHYCAGAFASRAVVADVALPGIFARLQGLRLNASEPVKISGWAFRGLLNLPVMWDAD